MNEHNTVRIDESLNTICFIHEPENYNFNLAYQKSRSVNRVLSRMEYYFRRHHLLEKYEMLEIRYSKTSDLRCGYMNVIGRARGWLYDDEFLVIVT